MKKPRTLAGSESNGAFSDVYYQCGQQRKTRRTPDWNTPSQVPDPRKSD